MEPPSPAKMRNALCAPSADMNKSNNLRSSFLPVSSRKRTYAMMEDAQIVPRGELVPNSLPSSKSRASNVSQKRFKPMHEDSSNSFALGCEPSSLVSISALLQGNLEEATPGFALPPSSQEGRGALFSPSD